MSDPLPTTKPHESCHADCARVHVGADPDRFEDYHVVGCEFVERHAFNVEVGGKTFKAAPKWMRGRRG